MSVDCPEIAMHWTASSKLVYLTVLSSLSIQSFTELPSGQDRWWISLNALPQDLGTRPMGETRRFGMGGVTYGPAIRPKLISFLSFPMTTLWLARAEVKFLQSTGRRGPLYPIEKPLEKPCFKTWAALRSGYLSRLGIRAWMRIGDGAMQHRHGRALPPSSSKSGTSNPEIHN